MKKHLLNSAQPFKSLILILIFLLSNANYSQITLTSEQFRSVFTTPGFHYYTEGTPGNYNIGKMGGPNVYDFSSISLQNLFVSNNYEVSSLPDLASRYPGNAITFGESPTTIEKNPIFLIGSDTAFCIGQASLVPSKEFTHYRPYDIVAVFPATYGSVINQQVEKFDTTFDGSGQVVNTNHSTSNEVTTIDGYGILKLSGHEYECIRIRKDHTGYGDKEYMFLSREGAVMLVAGVPISSPDTGFVAGYGQVLLSSSIADVNDEDQIDISFNLEQNFPNPFNPITKINYTLSKQVFVSLKVYDILGNEVSILVSEEQNAGFHEIDFNAENLASGAYLYKLQSGENVEIKKMIVLR